MAGSSNLGFDTTQIVVIASVSSSRHLPKCRKITVTRLTDTRRHWKEQPPPNAPPLTSGSVGSSFFHTQLVLGNSDLELPQQLPARGAASDSPAPLHPSRSVFHCFPFQLLTLVTASFPSLFHHLLLCFFFLLPCFLFSPLQQRFLFVFVLTVLSFSVWKDIQGFRIVKTFRASAIM